MSTEIKEKELIKIKPKEPFLSKRRKRILVDPLDENNPITIQVLGICSALAVTIKLEPTIIMALSVVFVMVFSSLITSLIRNFIPIRVRIIVQLAIIATLVTLVSEFLMAFNYEMFKVLGAFVGLIITNCIIIGRAEAFALGNSPWLSFWDGLGNGVGYGYILIVVGFFRVLLGAGALFGFQVIPQSFYDSGYENMGIMVLAPGVFITIGLLVWGQNDLTNRRG